MLPCRRLFLQRNPEQKHPAIDDWPDGNYMREICKRLIFEYCPAPKLESRRLVDVGHDGRSDKLEWSGVECQEDVISMGADWGCTTQWYLYMKWHDFLAALANSPKQSTEIERWPPDGMAQWLISPDCMPCWLILDTVRFQRMGSGNEKKSLANYIKET
jgi:hypothetical protein